MRSLSLSLWVVSLVFTACGDDDNVSCVSCSNELTADFTLCKEANGDASVNGQDTDTDYDTYLADLTAQGTSCN